jgi:hypothetical protein
MIIKYPFAILTCALLAMSPAADAQERNLYIVDSGGRPTEALEIGASLEVGARALQPRRMYEFEITLAGKQVSYARLTADARGNINPFILWFHSGVIGCAVESVKSGQRYPISFRDFDEAERALAGQRLDLIVREARAVRRSDALTPAPTVAPIARLAVPLVSRRSAMVFPTDRNGCLINSAETGSQDMFVGGRNFSANERVELSVVPNQRRWHVGDLINDVTGVAGAARSTEVRADANGRFVAKVWDRQLQRRGAYDIAARRLDIGTLAPGQPKIRAVDVISYAQDTAYILFLYYPPGGTLMDIAGRPLIHYPYFQFADSFADTNDDVWGAVDPTYVPAGHTGGTYAAYYVVNHRTTQQWAANTSLTDVSGGPEIVPVKAGCVNGTDVIIWHAPLTVGSYDVVVNFGTTAAMSQGAFADDFTYDSAVDFLDGAVQIGFRVAPDPYSLGSTPIGQGSYSFDDALFLSNAVSTFEGGAAGSTNVDLRAVVRYPATAAGTNTPVAAGAHPIFIIEHGNHAHCNILTTGQDFYQALAQALAGTMSWSDFNSHQHTHASCPVAERKLNHMGYMHLLDALASNGIIAVSIDAYDLTGSVPQWTAERGDLILKHLEFWSHLNDASTYTTYTDPFAGLFTGHVDLSKISVSGHSRGGEASVSSYVRNLLRPAAQQFSIGSVSSIAPVDAQGYVLGDVPYFVILPASDCDVSGLSGAKIYDRAGTATDQTVKSGIDVYGANHDFFNTVWAADWDDCGGPGRNDYIPAADQQKIGETYLAAFTRSQLLGQDVYEDMLRARMKFPSTGGYKIYNFRHEKNHLKLDAGMGAGTATGATQAVVANPSVHQTQAVRLNWTASSQKYAYSMPPTDVSGFEVLSFRVAQTNNAVNPATGQEFQVQLSSGGTTRLTYTGLFDPIPKPYDRGGSPSSNQNVMTTVRIPLHSFIMNVPLSLTTVDKVELIFSNPNQGEIYIDDVEFSR